MFEKFLFRSLTAVAVLMLLMGTAQATLLTFDDVPGGSIQDNCGSMSIYRGFDFTTDPRAALAWIDVEGSPWNFGAHSGDFALLCNNTYVGIVSDAGGADFTFGGLWAKVYGTAPESGGVDSLAGTLSGYNDGEPIWTVDTNLNGSYEYYGAQAGAIDELHLGFGDYFLMDDLLLNPIPEPSTLTLLVLGLLGIAFYGRRRR